jgi:hypothetical protein
MLVLDKDCSTAPRVGKWIERFAPITLGLALVHQALGKAGAICSYDIWFHLKTGDLIMESGRIPRADPFSWTAAGEAWQPNAWLADLLFALLRHVGDLEMLAVFRALSVVAIGFAVYGCVRKTGGRPWPATVAAGFATLLMNPFVIERPKILAFMLFPGFLLILRSIFSGSLVGFFGLALATVLWVNLHGSFIVGVAVAWTIAFARLMQTRDVLRPMLVVFLTGTALVINPFGYKAFTHALTISRVSGFVDEWQRLNIVDPRGALIVFYAVVTAFALRKTRRWRQLEVSLPLAGLCCLTLVTVRAAPFFLVVAAPEIAQGISTLGMPGLRNWVRPRISPILVGNVAAWVILIIFAAPTLKNLGQVGERFPVVATSAIPQGSRLLNEYEFGGYVIDKRWPEVHVSQDGRNDLYGVQRIREQHRILESSMLESLDRLNIECVLIRPDRPLAKTLHTSGHWKRRAGDSHSVLFIRIPTDNTGQSTNVRKDVKPHE